MHRYSKNVVKSVNYMIQCSIYLNSVFDFQMRHQLFIHTFILGRCVCRTVDLYKNIIHKSGKGECCMI